MTRHFFTETTAGSGIIEHTSFSAILVTQPAWRDWLGHCLEEVAPASLYLGQALSQKGETPEASECAFAQLHFPDHPEYGNTFGWWANDGEGDQKGWRAKRFANSMNCLADDPSLRIDVMLGLFDWESLGEGTIIDVSSCLQKVDCQNFFTYITLQIGGSRGHISFAILSQHPKLKAIVQDLPEIEKEFNPPADLISRATFQSHDFWTPEPVKNAQVYFMKHILHDWSDKYAAKILANIATAMSKDSRILIMEFIIPPPGLVPITAQRMITGIDIQMLVACHSQERTVEDWYKLVALVGGRLKIKAIHMQPGLPIGIVEVVLA
jgi:6-hydroxytryprostatin B O-methyltransferase